MKPSSISRVLTTTARDFGLLQATGDPDDASATLALRKQSGVANIGWESRNFLPGKSIRSDRGCVVGARCDAGTSEPGSSYAVNQTDESDGAAAIARFPRSRGVAPQCESSSRSIV
jgi:hypothetical protein